MASWLDHCPAGRWLLPVLVGLLVLGHVCDASAFGHPDAHHDDRSDEQLGPCDPAPAASSPGQGQWWWVAGTPVAPLAGPTGPARAAEPAIAEPVAPVDRLPLFLLHAALLI